MSPITNVKIIAIGDELLEGRTVDSNSQRIERALGGHGVRVGLIQVIADEKAAVLAALDRTEPGDLVMISGGLGSTPDDMTRELVAAWGGVRLLPDPQLRERLQARWQRRGVTLGAGISEQCQVPAGWDALDNAVGSAPGLVGELRGRHLVLLPGVPAELAGLLPAVVCWLGARGVLPAARPHVVRRTAQISELALVKRCAPVRDRHPGLRWSWWLSEWGVDIRVSTEPGTADGELWGAAAELDAALDNLVYAREMVSLPEVVGVQLTSAGATLSVAESCTGGLLGGALTAGAGASVFFRGGHLVYADDVKEKLLGVPKDILMEYGAVSEETVRFMAAGCRERVGTDYALAVSGVSGPAGGTLAKPVGTTWLAVATPERIYAHCYCFPAQRERNRHLAVAAAVDSLRRVIGANVDREPWTASETWCRPKSAGGGRVTPGDPASNS